ncbi:MAG TPA: hypothetical protein PK152_02455 [Anaerolineales bacterium]|nr:hypothetical protein [Anaerolineales bacterium]HRK87969.1 hypothetical protein [Anaerolineales bacterium]
MIRKIRLIFAIIILTISVAFLIWGFSPNPRETRIREISPTEMQLPTPTSLHPDFEPVA